MSTSVTTQPGPPLAERPPRAATVLYHHRTRSRDGQSIHIDELIHALRAAGHRVILVEPKRVPATQGSLRKRLLPKPVYELLELCYSFLEFAKLAAAARKHRPDALYQRGNIFMLSGVWTARLFGLPYLLEVNAPLAAERGKFGGLSLGKLAAWTERLTWRSADRVLPVTGVLARDIEKAGVPRARIAVTPNGVDLSRLKPIPMADAKRLLGLGDALVLGFVGFVREWHGLEHIVALLHSEPILKTARFLVVGDGPACAALRARAQELGVADRLIITGVFEHRRLSEYLSAIDIALQPEVTPYASPLKLFEYMALGRAIVAPDTENIREVLEHEVDSLVFPAGNVAALADAIRRLAADGPLRVRLGAAAAAKVVQRGLTWQRNAERVVAMIEELRRQPAARSNPQVSEVRR